MDNRQAVKKIRYVSLFMHIGDMHVEKTIYEIYPDGRALKTKFNCKSPDKKTKTELSVSPDLVQKFTGDVMNVVQNARWEEWGICTDDRCETLEITFMENAMKLTLDRSVSDGITYIGTLAYDLIDNCK